MCRRICVLTYASVHEQRLMSNNEVVTGTSAAKGLAFDTVRLLPTTVLHTYMGKGHRLLTSWTVEPTQVPSWHCLRIALVLQATTKTLPALSRGLLIKAGNPPGDRCLQEH